MAVLRTRPPPSLWSSPRDEAARTLGAFRATAFVEARFWCRFQGNNTGSVHFLKRNAFIVYRLRSCSAAHTHVCV